MSLRTFTGLTGEGHAALDSSSTLPVADLWYTVTSTNPHTRFIGTTAPRGLWRGGMIGLGFFPDDPSAFDPPVVGPWWFVHLEGEFHGIPSGQAGALYFGSYFWRLLPGVSVDLTIEWGF